MPATIAQKFRIREGMVLCPIHAPSDYKDQIGDLPTGVRIAKSPAGADQIHWFVQNRAQLEKELPVVLPYITGPVVCWIYYPKGSSGIQTDLTRDKGWDKLHQQDMQWISLVSFNDTWSAFGLRRQQDSHRDKARPPQVASLLKQYIDKVNKTVTIPEDLASAFRKNKEEEAFFNCLAYSHRKEYVEWIVTAKKEETRKKRVDGTIELLRSKKKNPNESGAEKLTGKG